MGIWNLVDMCYDGAGKTVENLWFEYFKDLGFGIRKAKIGAPGGGGGGEGVFHHEEFLKRN